MREPARPTAAEAERELALHIQQLAGPDSFPRPEQVAAIHALVVRGRRTLLVARTGFGKSAVYFSATKMLRTRGWGPTLVVSPLLALMRDQVAAARGLGLRAHSVNSANTDEWEGIETQLAADEVDLLIVAPERLNNQGFRERVFTTLLSRPFALVCDEAHCISDWGHDFRPDYLRLRPLLDEMPPWAPVLATTATANERVALDVASQLGQHTELIRTTLDRASLALSVVELPTEVERWASIADLIPRLTGSGIVYTLTINDAERLAAFLVGQGLDVAAYTGTTDPTVREELEDRLRSNELTALVATSSLGMGYDKPDLGFCIHLGLPPSPVSYYQQIGRAGRALARADVIAYPRPHDRQIWKWFETVALPPKDLCEAVLAQLAHGRPVTRPRLESRVNISSSRLTTLLTVLDARGAVTRTPKGWQAVPGEWEYPEELAARLHAMRTAEADQMLGFVTTPRCRLLYLREVLDDHGQPCGRCDHCTDLTWPHPPSELVERAAAHLHGADIGLEPRRRWPAGLDEPRGNITPDRQNRMGRALCRGGDAAWEAPVSILLSGQDDPDAFAAVIRGLLSVLRRWEWPDRPTWICPMPSRRRPLLIERVAERLGEIGKLPVHPALQWSDPTGTAGFQSDQANSAHQVANLWGRLDLLPSGLPSPETRQGPVLLVDDVALSRWTLTVAGALLRSADTGAVLPLVLRYG